MSAASADVPRHTDAPRARSGGAATARAVAFVAARRADAEQLGRDLIEDVHEPPAFAARLRDAFVRLADPEHLAGQRSLAPGIGALIGVRWPLHVAVARGFRAESRGLPATPLLFLADRLLREPELEVRWFAFGLLERTLAQEPERSWQLLRRAAREAGDWITVDSLAHAWARGILMEPYRWAELEQLVFSPSGWERRLVGATIATMPHVDRRAGRAPLVVERALPILAQLIGDAEPDVQKALGWAYRTLAGLDPAATSAALREEAARAVDGRDGHRAWVIRDALPRLPDADATTLRERLTGLRRRAGAPATSTAAETAARFAALGLGRDLAEPPLR